MLSNANFSTKPCGTPCVISFYPERQPILNLLSSHPLNISSCLISFLKSRKGGIFLSACWKSRQMVSNRSVLPTFCWHVRGLWEGGEAQLLFRKTVLTLPHCTIFILVSTSSVAYYCFFCLNQGISSGYWRSALQSCLKTGSRAVSNKFSNDFSGLSLREMN